MDFFTLAKKKQRATPFNKSSEMRFFMDNNIILREVPTFSRYAKGGSTFDVIRANIIIRALINKTAIEKAYFKLTEGGVLKKDYTFEDRSKIMKEVAKSIEGLPYFEEKGKKIYVPIFSRSLNRIYSEEFNRLEERPYKDLIDDFEAVSCDPFDTYGDELYNSLFTRLIQLKKTEKGSAYYDYDAWSIYFVNSAGRLEVSLNLFDRDLMRPAPNHMIDKLIPVVDAYYNEKPDEFFHELVKNRLISSSLVAKHLDANLSKKSNNSNE